MSTATRLDTAIKAVCPITGVAILDPVAHTVRIDFDLAATAAQQAAANGALAAFDWSAAADATFVAQQAKAAATTGLDVGQLQAANREERMIRGLAIATLDAINLVRANFAPPMPALTPAQWITFIKARIAATAE